MSWLPPTQNVDGSALLDLAGFRIYLGTSATALEHIVEVANPGLTSYVVENLPAATWYFGVKAYSRSGAESDLSNLDSKTIP